MNIITEPGEIIRSYRMEYQWVEEFIRKECAKWEVRRDPACSQVDCLEKLIPMANSGRWDFLSGMAVVVFIWILFEVSRRVGL